MIEHSVAIVGSRHFDDWDFFLAAVSAHVIGVHTIVSGGAPGVDRMAARLARERGCELVEHHADWKQFGPSAGPRRNELIVGDAERLIAFPCDCSTGTYDAIRKAGALSRATRVIPVRCRFSGTRVPRG